MNSKFIIPIIFVVSLSLSLSVQAQNEFTNGVLVFPDNALSTPHDPKVDCHPNGDHCLLAFYDQHDSKIKLKFSWNNGHHYEGLVFGCTGLDSLLGCSEVATVTNSLVLDRLPIEGELHLPFDVTWVNDDNTYYIFIENVNYQYVPFGSFSILRTNLNHRWGLQFVNETTFFEIQTTHNGDTTNTWNLMDITDYSTEATGKTSSTGGCAGVGATDYPTQNLIGFSAINDGTLFYRVYYGYNGNNCSGIQQGTSPEATVTGMSYYVNGIIQYEVNHNETKEALTSDFASYTSVTSIYEWNETEYINASMSDIIDTNQLYVYESNNETAGTISGIYVYNEQLYPLDISMGVQDPDRGGQFNDINVSGTIICEAENYTQTDTGGAGNLIELSTPCLTGNVIVIQTTEGSPSNFSFSYDVLSGCESETTYIYTPDFEGYVGTYNFTIRVRDSIFNSGVSGASVTLSGDTQTTDSSGNAYFDITPITNSNFETETNAGSCLYELSINGSERIYNIFTTASGYQDYTENSVILGESPFSLEGGDFTTVKTIIMDFEGSQAEVHVYSSDGIELFPSIVEVEAIGSNNTYVNNFGEFIESNISYIVPALFQLVDSRASFPVNFTLRYYYGDNFDYYQQNVTVYQEGFHIVNFYINENYANLKCTYDVDCPESLCSGTYYKEFSSCSNGLCTYSSERCASASRCDSEIGCFDIQYTQSCESNAECENDCLTNYTMVNQYCGSDDLCIGRTVECSTNCSISDGVCSELLSCINPEIHEFVVGYNDAFGNFAGFRTSVFCGFEQADQSECIVAQQNFSIDQIGSINNIIVNPSDWNYVNQGGGIYSFYAVSLTCSDTCGLSYDFCQYGCNTETGLCMDAPTGEQHIASNWIEMGWNFFTNLVPVYLRFLIWGIITILVMGIYRIKAKGGNNDTILIGFVTFAIGISLAWVHFIYLIIMGFLISFVLWAKYFHKESG